MDKQSDNQPTKHKAPTATRILNSPLLSKRIAEMWGGEKRKNLASILDVTETAIYKWENQQSQPKANLLDALRLYLGFQTIDDMFYHPNNKPGEN